MPQVKYVALILLINIHFCANAGPIALLKNQSLTTQWQTFEFNNTFTDAVIFSSMNTVLNVNDASYDDYTFDIRHIVNSDGINKGSFQARINWELSPFPNITIDASFLVAQKGTHSISDGLLEIGTIENATGEFQHQFASNFSSRPLLLLEQQTKSNSIQPNNYELTKASEVTSTGFTAVRQKSNNTLSTSSETMAYMALRQNRTVIDQSGTSIIQENLLANDQNSIKIINTAKLSEFVFFSEINGVLVSAGAISDISQYTQTGTTDTGVSGFINEGASRDGKHTVERVSLVGFRVESVSVSAPKSTLFILILFTLVIFSKDFYRIKP